MFRTKRFAWSMLLTVNVVSLCVLGFYGRSDAAPKSANEPFANSVEQRFEIIRQLQQINDQLKEQNALLKSGKLRVVVTDSKSR